MDTDSRATGDMAASRRRLADKDALADCVTAAIDAAIDALEPRIVARAAEAEAARRLPDDLIHALRVIGTFRMTVPKAKGGLELDFPSVSRTVQRLARIDGSVGWLGAVQAVGGVVLPRLPASTYQEIYQNGPDIMVAGSTQPTGTAEAVDGGWRINGRWPFASFCQEADWIVVSCVLRRDGRPLPGPVEGAPASSLAVLPARRVAIEDSWYSSGLRATGSHHIALRDAVVAERNLYDPLTMPSCMPGPLYGAPTLFITLLHGTLAVGIAEGALDDVVAMAQGGRRRQRAATAMRDSEIVHYELGHVRAKLDAARMVLDTLAASIWRQAVDGTLSVEARFTEVTQFAIWLTETCADIVRTCFTLGGGSAVFASSPLQRRLRDIEVAAQHYAVQPRHHVQAGRQLLDSRN